ncbi:MAG: hypothetical protein U0807_15015 [Candidatus Binatia bacterium]
MRIPVLLLALLLGAGALWPVRAQERKGLVPPTRGGKGFTTQDERDVLLEVAQQMRGKAAGLRDKADEMRQIGKDDLAGALDDRADGLEDRATEMEEEADELAKPPSTGGARRHGGRAAGS